MNRISTLILAIVLSIPLSCLGFNQLDNSRFANPDTLELEELALFAASYPSGRFLREAQGLLSSFIKLDLSSISTKTDFASKLREDFLYTSKELTVRSIFPNPANAKAFLDYNMAEQIKAKVTVRNLLGKVIKEYDLNLGEKRITIPTLDFDPGIYFYVLSINGKAKKGKKLIVNGH